MLCSLTSNMKEGTYDSLLLLKRKLKVLLTTQRNMNGIMESHVENGRSILGLYKKSLRLLMSLHKSLNMLKYFNLVVLLPI